MTGAQYLKLYDKKKKRKKVKRKPKANKLKTYQRRLKKRITMPEKIIKQELEKDLIIFEFQKIFHIKKSGYVVDFALTNIFNIRYVIEIDGNSHNSKEAKRYDAIRTKYLNKLGYIVIRFRNEDVINNLDYVMQGIYDLNPTTYSINPSN